MLRYDATKFASSSPLDTAATIVTNDGLSKVLRIMLLPILHENSIINNTEVRQFFKHIAEVHSTLLNSLHGKEIVDIGTLLFPRKNIRKFIEAYEALYHYFYFINLRWDALSNTARYLHPSLYPEKLCLLTKNKLSEQLMINQDLATLDALNSINSYIFEQKDKSLSMKEHELKYTNVHGQRIYYPIQLSVIPVFMKHIRYYGRGYNISDNDRTIKPGRKINRFFGELFNTSRANHPTTISFSSTMGNTQSDLRITDSAEYNTKNDILLLGEEDGELYIHSYKGSITNVKGINTEIKSIYPEMSSHFKIGEDKYKSIFLLYPDRIRSASRFCETHVNMGLLSDLKEPLYMFNIGFRYNIEMETVISESSIVHSKIDSAECNPFATLIGKVKGEEAISWIAHEHLARLKLVEYQLLSAVHTYYKNIKDLKGLSIESLNYTQFKRFSNQCKTERISSSV